MLMIDLEKKAIDPEVLERLEMTLRNMEMSGFSYTEEEKERLRNACTSDEALDAEMLKCVEEAERDIDPEILKKVPTFEELGV